LRLLLQQATGLHERGQRGEVHLSLGLGRWGLLGLQLLGLLQLLLGDDGRGRGRGSRGRAAGAWATGTGWPGWPPPPTWMNSRWRELMKRRRTSSPPVLCADAVTVVTCASS
jgi:hypothetical protein